MSPAEEPPRVVRAAGAVLWRVHRGRMEVALVHRPRYRDWSLPKGKLDDDEEPHAAAVREVQEETGCAVVLGVPLPPVRYRTADGAPKHVDYWAARVATPDDAAAVAVRGAVERAGLDEIDDVVWVSIPTAVDLLTRDDDRGPLDAAVALRAAGRLATRALVVVRHGKAESRDRWDGGEATRPLTEVGKEQAAALVPVLAAFGVGELATSPWERCASTIAPYAEGTGLRVRAEDVLTETAYRKDPDAALAVVRDLLDKPRDAAVVMHRPVLPAALHLVRQASRRWTTGQLPKEDPYLRTGEALVCHVALTARGTRVVAIERHRPGPTAG